jgi:dihydroorotase
MSDGLISSKLGLPSIIQLSQSSEVAKICEMSSYFNVETIFELISTKRAIKILKRAKKYNKFIKVEVGVSHLILSDKDCDEFNSLAKIYPPLEDSSTRKKLIKSLKNGLIDVITSAHNAQTLNSKDMPFDIASFGIDLSEYYLPLIYTNLVQKHKIPFKDIAKLISYNPAQILNLKNEGLINEGYSADLVIFNPNATTRVKDNISSFYQNQLLNGRVEKTFVNGEIFGD